MTIATPVEQQQSPLCLPDDLVADYLAGRLRSSRLTVLYGEAANPVGEFIATSVAPRLGRRQWDRCLTQSRRDEFIRGVRGEPVSGRRLCASAELLVLVDSWASPAIATLQKRINDSFESAGAYMTSVSLPIADSLSAWSRLLDVRFLIILDRFEEFLAGHAQSDDGRRFTDELVQVLRSPRSDVNFLLCAAASSEADLQHYQMQFGDVEQASSVRLPLHRASVPSSASDLIVIEWREPPLGRELAGQDPDGSGNRLLRAGARFRAVCAATITAIAMFCWPTLQPNVHFDAAEYLTLAARAVERGLSELYHRIEHSLTRVGVCADGRSARCDTTSQSP